MTKMKKLKILIPKTKGNEDWPYPKVDKEFAGELWLDLTNNLIPIADLAKIQLILTARGYKSNVVTNYWAWSNHSAKFTGGWIRVVDDDEAVFQIMMKYLEIEKKKKSNL